MGPILGGRTRDTDFNKGFTKRFVYKKSSAKKWGGQGNPDTLIRKRQCTTFNGYETCMGLTTANLIHTAGVQEMSAGGGNPRN